MSNIQFAEDIIRINLDNALLKLEDSKSKKQVSYRTGICTGLSNAFHELGFITKSQYIAYNKQVEHILADFIRNKEELPFDI